jgi:isoleucyl-tRNA synthetase
MIFKEVEPIADFTSLEHRILEFWEETKAFQKLVALNQGKKKWSFIDGPITANNPMGVHHAWGRTYKDLFQRYHAMNGCELRYQNGFDCQGLWIEVEVERELGFQSKRDIEAYGVAKFIKKCKERALRYAAIQVEQSKRLGYWMNWGDQNLLRELASGLEHPDQIITVQGSSGQVSDTVEKIVSMLGTPKLGGSYFTFSDENNYTIWKFLKKCHEQGLIYRGRDVMPWCPRCSTALSQHEIVTEGYRELTHLGITLKFPLRDHANESLLIWTTTPWTLTSNVAAAANPNITYVKVRYNNEFLILAEAALNQVFPQKDYEIVEKMLGEDLEGWTYYGPFDELPAERKSGAVDAHHVILWDDVSEKEGTGIVHIAPGCGKEDFELGKQYGLPAVAPLNEFGVFIEGFGWLTGTNVYESAEPVIQNLKEKGVLLEVEEYTHRYPVCWRCGNELVFRLVDEWFISMGEKLDKPLENITHREKERNLRYQIMEVAKQICWIPEFGLQQELDWLRNMEDWMISKKRYWGLALPIWKCDGCGNFEVMGSEEELRSRAVEGWEEFEGHTPHRPWIDKVKIECSRCGATISRISDVGNPWLDAGIVAYSTLEYRHDPNYWKTWFPADLACEELPGQYRNWFYSMLAMSTLLEQRPPFLTCFGHGSVLAEDGREMHKSWGNEIPFNEAVENMGADVMRWIYCTTRPENNIVFSYKRAEEVKRQFLIPLWNVYRFFVTYANLDKWAPGKSANQYSRLDRWILSKLQVLIQDVTECIENYDPFDAANSLEEFVDQLSKWYIRRSRRRFWKSETDTDKNAAYTTLYTCLTTLAKLLAPFISFLTEEIYQNLVRGLEPKAPESVHHQGWPKTDSRFIDEELMENMDLTIQVTSLGRYARNKAGIKLRQPLLEAKIVAEENLLTRLQKLIPLIKKELNVKKVRLTTEKRQLVSYRIRLLPQILGEKYGPLLPKLQEAVNNMDVGKLVRVFQSGCSVEVKLEEQIVTLLPEQVNMETQPKKDYMLAEESGTLVGIKTVVTEELANEGLARDIVRRVQNQRKDAGFDIEDKIIIYYETSSKIKRVLQEHQDYISEETLATNMLDRKPPEDAYIKEYKIKGEQIKIGLIQERKK